MPQRILLVEDEPSNVKLIKHVLERRGGYAVHHTEDPEEALGLAAGGEIVLVVMDVSLSGSLYKGQPVDGIELTKMIKQDQRSACLPVVLATAHTMKGDRERLLAASGADDYVGKPITDFDRFLQMIASHIAACAPRSPRDEAAAEGNRAL